MADLKQVLKGLHDEDEGDERREGFFGESGEVTNQGTSVRSNQHDTDNTGPESDPNTERDVINPKRSRENKPYAH